MPNSNKILLKFLGLFLMMGTAWPHTSSAQQAPFTLDEVISLVGGVGAVRALDNLGKRCLAFSVDATAALAIKKAGSPDSLLPQFRALCVIRAADTGPRVMIAEAKDLEEKAPNIAFPVFVWDYWAVELQQCHTDLATIECSIRFGNGSDSQARICVAEAWLVKPKDLGSNRDRLLPNSKLIVGRGPLNTSCLSIAAHTAQDLRFQGRFTGKSREGNLSTRLVRTDTELRETGQAQAEIQFPSVAFPVSLPLKTPR